MKLSPTMLFSRNTVLAAMLALPIAGGVTVEAQKSGDAEILAWLIALNENEVSAAMTAEQKASTADQPKLSEPVVEYAKMLHVQHAKGVQDTKELATKIGVMPVDTASVQELRAKGKQGQAKLTPLTGTQFERAFIAQMADGHREALKKVEGFLKTASHDALKQHLSATRDRVTLHLKEAERLQSLRS
jgi:putative membrane protein